MKKLLLSSATVLLLSAVFLSQTVGAQSYKIDTVRYAIVGKTTEQALARTLKINTERVFSSQAELESYVQSLRTQLASCRTFDTTSITETVPAEEQTSLQNLSQTDEQSSLPSQPSQSSQNSNMTVPVTLTVSVHDTHNVIIVPYPSYSSNTGVSVKIKLKDYNFAGTLAPLSASLYYASDDDTFDLTSDKLAGGSISLVTPFTLWSKDAFLTTSADVSYAFNRNNVLFNGTAQFEYYPISSGPFSWGPYISASGGKNNAYTEGGYECFAAVGQKLFFQRIVWNGNFRSGAESSLIQTFDYDFVNSTPFVVCTAVAEQFCSSSRIGFSAREFFNYESNDELLRNAGSYLRGIRDRDIRTDIFFACNIEMPFTLAVINFPESSKLSLFDCEVQCSPFIDAAVGHNEAASSYFAPKDGWYSFGLDVNVFPSRWRSLQVHGSLGFDAAKALEKTSSIADNLLNTSWRNGPLYEISIGIGLFY